MKNQYFGDINDYRKYGLLRILTDWGRTRLAVSWMLTPDDSRTDGSSIGYLDSPEKYASFDPDLFSALQNALHVQRQRDIHLAERAGILPNAKYYDQLLSESLNGRSNYFESFWKLAEGSELVFFDPDNGLEVKSTPKGRKGSERYLYWDELNAANSRGYSVLIYQHFPRQNHASFISHTADEINSHTGSQTVFSFSTPKVVFFLLTAANTEGFFAERAGKAASAWGDQIKVKKHEYSPRAESESNTSKNPAPVKITVTSGRCDGGYHGIGTEFIVKSTTPGGMCLGAWNSIAPYVTALRHGADFPWEKEKGVATIKCPDPEGITLELRRIEN
ncbi:TIGR04076 family protein [Candidatus Sumerlaeota bacterium]